MMLSGLRYDLNVPFVRLSRIVDYFDIAIDDYFKPMVWKYFLKVFLYSFTLWSTDVFEPIKAYCV